MMRRWPAMLAYAAWLAARDLAAILWPLAVVAVPLLVTCWLVRALV